MMVYRNMSIKTKMVLMILLMMLLMAGLAFGSFSYAYSIYDRQLYDKSYRLLNLSSASVDQELKRLEALSLRIIADTQIQQGLIDLIDDDTEYSDYMSRKQLTERLFEHINASERYVQSVHLIDPQDRVNRYGDSVSFSEEKYALLIQAAEAGNGAVRWVAPDDADPMLIMVRQVRSYEPMTLKPLGVLFLRINIQRLAEDYAGMASEHSDIVLKDGDQVIYPYKQISDAVTAGLQPLPGGEGYEIKKVDGEEVFLSQKHSSYTGWRYYNIVSYDDIFRGIIWLKNTLILVFVVATLLVVALGAGFARSLTKPIRLLIGQMKEVQHGDLEQMDANLSSQTFRHMDEVGLLQRTFRLMIARINMLIKENYANKLVIKETEFKALQAQINPHFLYNALDSIHWLAKKNAQGQISSMVVSLGYLLRSSISLKRNVITVAEELEIVRHYITIQQYRFRDRLDFQMDVPETYNDALIPKLTLQPLLENAIQYGLEPMIEPCAIRLYAVRRDDRLALVVEDKGPGMEPDFVQRVLDGEVETRGTGIGLLNIRDRVQLAFGEEYGIEVESEAGAGTKVSVWLPLPQEGVSS